MEVDVFIVVQEMQCDNGGGASIIGAYSSEEKANNVIEELETERDTNPTRYKYPTSWFISEHVIDEELPG